MKLTIKRIGKKYIVPEDSTLWGLRNRTAGLLLRKLKVYSNGSIIYTMEQRGIIKKTLINLLYLLFRPQMIPSYLIYKENMQIGKSQSNLFKVNHEKLYIYNLVYDLNLYANNCMTILRNNKQIALVKKNNVSYANQDEYNVLYESDLNEDRPLLLLLVMCLDVAFWSERVRWNGLRWEKTIGKESLPNEVNWQPLN